MIATMEYINILDKGDEITKMIINSESMHNYKCAYNTLKNDEEAQRLINAFLHMKDLYEDVQRFGHYHPDYHEIMKNVRSAKRKMDMHPSVSAFKIEERNIQGFLDDISEQIAGSVSGNIMVPRDGLAQSDSGCSTGGCGSGGSCSCQAS